MYYVILDGVLMSTIPGHEFRENVALSLTSAYTTGTESASMKWEVCHSVGVLRLVKQSSVCSVQEAPHTIVL